MNDQEKQENTESKPDDDVCWHSSRLRMARMVDPYGCDALVDHILLYRASARAWTNEAVAIGRSLEREDGAAGRVAWRLIDVISMDILPENLDGAEIYSEPVFLEGSDILPFGTTFDPERSTPVEHRLMTLDRGDVGGETASWFSVKIRLACMVEKIGVIRFEDGVFLLRAGDFRAAFQRAIAIGRSREREFVNMNDRRTNWMLVGVLSLSLLGVGAFHDGMDVYREEVTLEDDDRVPFNTVFHPEDSNPAMTIG